MAEAAEKAAYRAVSNRLFNVTDAGENVFVQYVPENKTRPYILLNIQAGGERNFHTRMQDPELVMLVKAVSTDPGEALDIMQVCKELLDDQGEQDLLGLSGGNDWHLLKVMVEEHISMTYMVGTTRIFESGFQARITMQEK